MDLVFVWIKNIQMWVRSDNGYYGSTTTVFVFQVKIPRHCCIASFLHSRSEVSQLQAVHQIHAVVSVRLLIVIFKNVFK